MWTPGSGLYGNISRDGKEFSDKSIIMERTEVAEFHVDRITVA